MTNNKTFIKYLNTHEDHTHAGISEKKNLKPSINDGHNLLTEKQILFLYFFLMPYII